MNWESLLTIGVALCCVFAISTAATSLESSVTTDPDEVIDLDETGIPIGTDNAVSLKSQVQSEGTPDTSSSADPGDGQVEESSAEPGDGDQTTAGSGDGERTGADSGAGDRSGGSDSANQGQDTGPGAGEEQAGGPGTPPQSLLDKLLALLAALLDLLRALVPAIVALGLVALGIRHRDRLGDMLRERLERWGLIDPVVDEEPSEPPTRPDPTNQVSAAWYEFVEALGLGDARACAPRECADAARDEGVDEETIAALTEPFEEVRYGEEPVTDDRRRRARDGLERFRARHGGQHTGGDR
ncbi:DUF4129 domain-containing protein [Haloarchaeobius sp. TZWSO28]|uniref:DUF4129 domain-containing protein n=1 Tax=Haloarchaeobius sp. TZWSO28 TaxID=3446119 RepID=UPI003EBFB88A